ncbi:MAG TPA: hypothetical protein PKA37_08370, partial [Planctomycetota bacterium]|nr:hypothetical protein [Planctomycetota bacterium]
MARLSTARVQRRVPETRARALLLLGLTTTLAVAGVVLPTASDDSVRRDADAVVALVRRVKQAAERHYLDTGRFAVEQPRKASTTAQQLASPQDYPGWRGPYLPRPLSHGDHPGKRSIEILDRAEGLWPGGMRCAQTGRVLCETRQGSVLLLRGVPKEVAKRVDLLLDRSLESEDPEWAKHGCVEYRAGSLSILVA